MKRKCIIARHQEGISLNDYEYILDEKNEIKVFENKEESVDFLKQHGLSDEDIEPLKFLDYEKFQENIHEEIN